MVCCHVVWAAVVGMCVSMSNKAQTQMGAGMSSLSVPMRYRRRALAGQRENNSEQCKLRAKASASDI